MRRILRAAISLSAATAVIVGLGGASLPFAAAAEQPPSASRPTMVFPAYRAVPPVLSDRQLIVAAAPVRKANAAKAAAAAAAAAAAKKAALAAARNVTVASARRISFVSSAGHSVYVWTSGFQAQVNACRGGVDLTAAYHTRTVGEHWSCGGSSFPESAGALVTFTGLDAGTYRVIGVVATLNAYVAHTRNIPHGYAMLFQTCRAGDSHYTIFIALARVS
jgi:hypothetical protein